MIYFEKGESKMKFNDYINHFCETCNKELKDEKELKKHYNRNHTIRTRGQFSIIDKKEVNKGKKNIICGKALSSAKAGEDVNILI